MFTINTNTFCSLTQKLLQERAYLQGCIARKNDDVHIRSFRFEPAEYSDCLIFDIRECT